MPEAHLLVTAAQEQTMDVLVDALAEIGVISDVVDSLEDARQAFLAQGGHRFVVRGEPEVRYHFEVSGDLATAFELEEYGTRFRAVRIE